MLQTKFYLLTQGKGQFVYVLVVRYLSKNLLDLALKVH